MIRISKSGSEGVLDHFTDVSKKVLSKEAYPQQHKISLSDVAKIDQLRLPLPFQGHKLRP